MTDYKEEVIKIDGKKAQLAIYKYVQSKTKLNYVANIYVIVDESKGENVMTNSLSMSITSETENELKTAKRIFRSIHFNK